MDQYSFKNLLLCYLCCLVPVGLIVGILSLLKVIPVSFNGLDYFGLAGLGISLGIAFFCSIVFAVINFIFLNVGRLVCTKLFMK